MPLSSGKRKLLLRNEEPPLILLHLLGRGADPPLRMIVLEIVVKSNIRNLQVLSFSLRRELAGRGNIIVFFLGYLLFETRRFYLGSSLKSRAVAFYFPLKICYEISNACFMSSFGALCPP